MSIGTILVLMLIFGFPIIGFLYCIYSCVIGTIDYIRTQRALNKAIEARRTKWNS